MDFESAENLGIKAVFEKYKNEIHMDFDEFCVQWKKWAQHFFDKYSAGELTFDDQRKGRITKVFELNGNPIKSKDELDSRFSLYWSTYEKEYNLFSDALPALKKLSDTNIQMGIITNGDSENQRSKLKKAGVTDFFSPIVISSEVGISKPDLKIFQKAMELANSSESETHGAKGFLSITTAFAIFFALRIAFFCIRPAPKIKIFSIYFTFLQ